MKVLDIYSKKDLDVLTCQGKVVSEIMNKFFSKFPIQYRENYDKNVETLEIWRVDESQAGYVSGEYFEIYNIMILRSLDSVIHELMHVAGCDFKTRISGFQRKLNMDFHESSLLEGCAEFLSAKELGSGPCDYFFESFSVAMLSNIDGIFEPYFVPNHKKFINLFPNKTDILSLMYALSYYACKYEDVIGNKINILDDNIKGRVERSIKDVMDSLINIQLSMKMSKSDNIVYSERFMDLITGDVMDDCLGIFSGDYMDYANEQINKRVLRRIR